VTSFAPTFGVGYVTITVRSPSRSPKHIRTVPDVRMRGCQEGAVKGFPRYAFGYHSGLGVTRNSDIPEAKDAPIEMFADFWFGGHGR
jgi:hypothetical protein